MILPGSRLYHCRVVHQRLRPRRRPFSYGVFMLDLDLGKLDETVAQTRWLAHNRFHLFSVQDCDHVDLGVPGGIRANLAAWLAGNGITLPKEASVRLITFPRVLGYGFNPVSFYYIHDAEGAPWLAVAEVVNTYREMKLYLVDVPQQGGWNSRQAKDFYVSPFSDPGDQFDFRLGPPHDPWSVHIDDLDQEGKVLVTSIQGRASPLTSWTLFTCAFRYPLLSLKIIGGIHWQALRLWLAGTPYFKKSDRAEAQTQVLRRHPTPKPGSP